MKRAEHLDVLRGSVFVESIELGFGDEHYTVEATTGKVFLEEGRCPEAQIHVHCFDTGDRYWTLLHSLTRKDN